jgi:hypothetical protein
MVHIAPLATGAHQHRSRGGLHAHIPDRREIDHHGVIANSQTGRVMAATADGNLQTTGFRSAHGGDDVGDIATLGYQPRLAIDHPVKDFSGGLVLRIVGLENRTAKPAPKFSNSFL